MGNEIRCRWRPVGFFNAQFNSHLKSLLIFLLVIIFLCIASFLYFLNAFIYPTIPQRLAQLYLEDMNKIGLSAYENGFNVIFLCTITLPKQDQVSSWKVRVLAVDYNSFFPKRTQFLEKLIAEDFVPVILYNIHPPQVIPELNGVETFIFLQKNENMFLLVCFHTREDNTWWFGEVQSDPAYKVKLAAINLKPGPLDWMGSEGAMDRFATRAPTTSRGVYYAIPSELFDIGNVEYIECNLTQAAVFRSQFHVDNSPTALRFKHKVWKMLSNVKTVLESLKVVFWLSSGTLLGYFRECDIIAHSKDVDIGIMASSYTDKIISEMQNHGFRLKISLGLPNDSMELSFVDQSGVKLDMFFFYEEGNYYWNGGTQVKSGRKFKYTFPKFTLCWTLFKDLRVRVPCETEAYIKANYGPNWFIPVKSWDWKSSPFNVKPNGVWNSEQLSSAIKLFP